MTYQVFYQTESSKTLRCFTASTIDELKEFIYTHRDYSYISARSLNSKGETSMSVKELNCDLVE